MKSVAIRFVSRPLLAGVLIAFAPAAPLLAQSASETEPEAQTESQTDEFTNETATAAALPDDVDPTPEARVERLDRLFGALATAEGEESERIAGEIRGVWSRSGSDSMDLLLNRAQKAMNRKAFGKARSHLSALTRLAPDFAEGWNASATLYYLEEDFWRAAEHVEKTLALEPRHFSALSGLALILERVGRKPASLRTWREVERLYPGLDRAREAIERLAPEVDGRTL